MISDDFYEFIIALLGGGLIDVELEKADVNVAFKKAKMVWQQKGNDNISTSIIPFEVKAGVNRYVLPSGVNEVRSIIRTQSERGYLTDDPFVQSSIQDLFAYNSSGSSMFATYELASQLNDIRDQYRSNEPKFRYHKSTNELILANPPSSDRTWAIEVYLNSSDEAYERVNWIVDYTLAESKYMLGRAYRKMGTLPSPVGENQLDGDQLIQEAQTDIERLIEEIEHFTDGDACGLGVYIG